MTVLVVALAILVASVVGIEAFRAVTRRPLAEEWVRLQGWTLESIRYRLPRRNNWNTYFDVQIREPSGRLVEGEAQATGFIRRKVSIDWGGSGRGM